MLKYIVRRLILSIPVIIGVSIVAFSIISLAPGDFLDSARLNPSISRERLELLEQQYGLDRAPVTQYFLWFSNVLRGNWGYSFEYRRPVWDIMLGRVEATLLLSISTFIFTWGIGIPLGIYSALNQYKVSDQALSVFGFVGISIPNFFFALLFLFFAARTGLFPIGGQVDRLHDTFPWFRQILDYFYHLIGPVITLGLAGLAGTMRIMRGQLLDELNKDYVEFARSKGMPKKTVVFKHSLRNAINPIITSLGFSISGLLGGAILTENVFAYPGMGSLILTALQQQDIFLVMANLIMSALLLIVGNLIADILLAAVDPRVRLRFN